MIKKSGKDKKAGKGKAAQQVTSEEALDFIRDMQKEFRNAPRTREENARLQKYLATFTDGLLKAVGLRVQSDLLLRPSRTIRRKDFTKSRPPGHGSADRHGGDDRK